MHILLTGGGTLGPVTPLLALVEEIQKTHPETRWSWIGTETGPEKALIASYGIPFFAIPSGKFRRYASLQNIADLWHILRGIFSAKKLLTQLKPDRIVSAGGFVAVPVVWAGWQKKIPVHIHQQDVRIGLANKLCASAATSISVAWQDHLAQFPRKKTAWVGNPVRPSVLKKDRVQACAYLGLDPGLPVVIILGGGTGAVHLNELVVAAAPYILRSAQMLHLTGKNKALSSFRHPQYHQRDFVLGDMGAIYSVADLAITRAGMGTLSELAANAIPSIIIPIAGSHQEENAKMFAKSAAAVYVDEYRTPSSQLAEQVMDVLDHPAKMQTMIMAMQSLLPVNATSRLSTLLFS